MSDTLPFTVQLTADRKYVNVRIPVAALPAHLQKCPSAMNVRLTRESGRIDRWTPPFLLALEVGQ
jgi:hypothetical protein